ncbi:MAG: cytidine deaminase [bacterium]
MNFEKLFAEASKISPSRKLSISANCGGVGAALITAQGKIYTGICIDTYCGLGFCAEHSAIAEMLKNGESEIKEILAVKESFDNSVISPCGRCRELMLQIDPKNKDTVVYISNKKAVKLSELLPEHWMEGYKKS